MVQKTTQNPQYLDRVLDALQGATTIDYAAYQVMLVSFRTP